MEAYKILGGEPVLPIMDTGGREEHSNRRHLWVHRFVIQIKMKG